MSSRGRSFELVEEARAYVVTVFSDVSVKRALRSPSSSGSVGEAALLLVAALAAWATVLLVEELNPDLELGLAGGIFLLGVLALALTRFDLAVGIGVLLLVVVRFEPAPADVVLAVLISVSFVTGAIDLRQMPLSIFGLVGALLIITMISSIGAIDLVRAASFALITAYLIVLAVWLTSYVRSFNQIRLLVRAYIAGAVAVTIPAIAALFVSFPGSDLLLFGDDRAKALFKDPNVFGPFLIPGVLIIVGELLSPRLLSSSRFTKSVLGLILVAGVFFSYSRAAWLSLAMGLAAMFPVVAFRRRGGRQAAALVVAMVVATLGIAAVVAISGSGGFLRERAQFQSYDAERFGAQASGAQLAWEHPFGIGPGQFERVFDISAHSSYVRTLAEQGIVGASILVALMLTTLFLALRNAVSGRSTYGLGSATLFGAWCGILVNSAFVDTIHWRHLWIVAALIWIGATRPSAAEA
jgi:O-antigen ligase